MTKLITAVIIEDEIPAARLLLSVLTRLRPAWQISVLPGNVEDAVEWFARNPHPDLIFLDIQLADGLSFDFLKKAQPRSSIIFTTAYDQYAVRAFAVNSIDYILKPVEESRLTDAILRFESNSVRMPDYIEHILEALRPESKRYRTRFLIAMANKYITLQIHDVAYFYSENKITSAVDFGGKKYALDMTLDHLCDQLDPDLFFRANRQTILSIGCIKKIEPYFNGKISVTIHPQAPQTISVSREKVAAFKSWLNY